MTILRFGGTSAKCKILIDTVEMCRGDVGVGQK